ncbi:hypothetical protein GGI11_006938 [Coemansia sp. RSA 2049]|nr:hypothetical protein GGI11_006938 [Coemansia sp. RSA 2049]KAJ2611140.1 hypothetical protein EV177_003624 [Coemansia sp. RSA 1804]
MPRVTRQRTKLHISGDISSAPVLLEEQRKGDNNSDNTATDARTKKTKRIDRHKKWMEKIDAARVSKKQRLRQEGRATNKSALVRGLGGMRDSLREIQAQVLAAGLLSLDGNERKKGDEIKPMKNTATAESAPKSRRARNNAAIKEEKRFGQVLLHPAFQANPLATIRQHLANTLTSNADSGNSKTEG